MTFLVVVVFLFDLLTGGFLRANVRAGSTVISQWLKQAANGITGMGIFTTRAALESQNRSLVEQLAQFEERAGGYDALKAENEQLRALAHLVEGSGGAASTGVTAPVVSSVQSSPYGTFLIGAGAADGITRGSYVITSGGFVVGLVSDMGPHTAVVAELFAPNTSLNATVGGAAIAAHGSGGGNARAQVPRGLSIVVGDPVLSPELGQRPIGIVGNIASSSASASQDVSISLPVNLASLVYVYIIPVRN